MRQFITGMVVAAALTLNASPAAAEAFVVRGAPGSFIIFDFEGDFFRLAGDGFSISGREAFGEDFPRIMGAGCTLCAPGDIVDPSFRTPGDLVALGDGDGEATIGGTTYTNLTYLGRFDVDATPVTFPETAEFFSPIRTPFVFTGFLQAFSSGTQVFEVNLVGQGIVGLPFEARQQDGRYEVEEGRVNYVFTDAAAPVPEPATMVLLGTGLAGLVAARRRIKP